MGLIELGAVLGAFLEGGQGPSHEQLDRAFQKFGLAEGDPAPAGRAKLGAPVGKTKRVRQLFVHANDCDPAAGLELAQHIVALLRAEGAFVPDSLGYAGSDKITRLRSSFATLGFTLDLNGATHATVIDNLEGAALTEALKSYVNRINLNPQDIPLQLGSGKDFDEAVARHVLETRRGAYPVGGRDGNFVMTLAAAFEAVGLAVPSQQPKLDSDPYREVQQCLFLLGVAINRLRNDAGTGHGRPGTPLNTSALGEADGRLVARATAVIASALLDRL